MHFLAENDRVPQQVQAIKDGNFDRYLQLMKESGRSSYMYLQNVIPSGYKQQQDMAIVLALCEEILGQRGGFRVHGGGFAGTVQAFVPMDLLEVFRSRIDAVLGDGACHVLSIRAEGGVEAAEA
jgi:galactokinase